MKQIQSSVSDKTPLSVRNQCIKDFEQILNISHFYRIGRSFIVNLHYVIEIETGSNPVLILINNETLTTDKKKIKIIDEKLQVLQREH